LPQSCTAFLTALARLSAYPSTGLKSRTPDAGLRSALQARHLINSLPFRSSRVKATHRASPKTYFPASMVASARHHLTCSFLLLQPPPSLALPQHASFSMLLETRNRQAPKQHGPRTIVAAKAATCVFDLSCLFKCASFTDKGFWSKLAQGPPVEACAHTVQPRRAILFFRVTNSQRLESFASQVFFF